MRLIDADAIEYTHAIARSLEDLHNWNELCVTQDEIADMPTIETEPVQHGHWKPLHADSKGYTNHWSCSECSRFVSLRYNDKKCEFDYCPMCGAKMDEVSE